MIPQDLDLSTYEELYDYIIESHENGQKAQAKEIYDGLTDKRKEAFIDYLESFFYEAHHYETTSELIHIIKFFLV